MPKDQLKLEELYSIIKNKIEKREDGSYSYSLYKEGIEKINRKIGEEAVEVIIASFAYEKENSDKNKDELVGEIADLLYHNLTLLAAQNIEFSDILAKLSQRNKK